MDKEESKFYTWIVGICAVVIISLILSVSIYNYKSDQLFVDAGYTQETLIGHSIPEWVKVDKK